MPSRGVRDACWVSVRDAARVQDQLVTACSELDATVGSPFTRNGRAIKRTRYRHFVPTTAPVKTPAFRPSSCHLPIRNGVSLRFARDGFLESMCVRS